VPSTILPVALKWPLEGDVLQLSPQDVVLREVVKVGGEAEDAKNARQHRETDGEISAFQPSKRLAIDVCPSRHLGLRHVAP
jgi:hypothetical protein